jgi:RNA polymerase sigma-70 factor (ECF subfamily)
VHQRQRDEYEWLFRATYPAVLRTVFLITRDRARAEDVCQDAYLQLLEHWSKVSDYEHPEAWVRKVAVRMAVKTSRRDARRFRLEIAGRDRLDETHAENWPDLDLADALASLTPMQRAAVILYYLEDRPVLEVARVLQVSTSTVKQHLHRARHRLADLLGEGVTEDVR